MKKQIFYIAIFASALIYKYNLSAQSVLAAQSLDGKVLVNQAGYLRNSLKVVYFDQPVDSFYVCNFQDSTVVFKGRADISKFIDPATDLIIYKGDFTNFSVEGKYFIKDNFDNKSVTFEISDTVFNSLFYKSLKAFYFQRCGTDLNTQNAGEYYHSKCHGADGFFHPSCDTTGFKLATGGWHDAGDFGKYVVNAGISVGTLLMAYEIFPERFGADDLNIPESGNGIPDILDEVKYELNWLLKMQREDGAVFTKLTPENFAPFMMPQFDNSKRYIYQVSSTATADFTAMTAMASRIYKNYDETFSDECLQAAVKAWSFLEKNTSIVPPGGFKNPAGTNTGEYGDDNDADERLWASVELFISTHDQKYHDYFSVNYKSGGTFNGTMNWQNVQTLAQLSYLMNNDQSLNSTIKDELFGALKDLSERLVSRSQNDGFNVTIQPGEYYWGSNSNVLNNAVILICAFKLTNDHKYFETALQQLNYILGVNAHQLSFVTGIGERHVMNPHHRASASDGVMEPVPGFVAGGPNQYLQDDELKRNFNSSTPPALCYLDDTDSYASNEVAINWNAPLVFAAGFFSGEGRLNDVEKVDNILPKEIRLEQNYPNPFNPTTTLSFVITHWSFVSLKVYDILGKEVATLVNEEKFPGTYEVKFDASYLASGIYFYCLTTYPDRITAGNPSAGSGHGFSETKKMVLLR